MSTNHKKDNKLGTRKRRELNAAREPIEIIPGCYFAEGLKLHHTPATSQPLTYADLVEFQKLIDNRS